MIYNAFSDEYLKSAYTHSFNNKNELVKSKICGCFGCGKIFKSSEIKSWIQDENLTGLCPYCNIDSLIGDASGYPITEEFLKEMNIKLF